MSVQVRPQAEELPAGEKPENPKTLARFDTLDRKLASLGKGVGIVQNTNWLIVIVLFVALLAITFTAVFTFIQAINSDTQSRKELTESVNQLHTEVEVLNRTNRSQ